MAATRSSVKNSIGRLTTLARGLSCVLLALALAAVPSASQLEEPAERYFEETGHTVRGEFLRFYDDRGGPDLFGPPVSPEIMEDGVRVQYFRNVRLEWRPENPPPYRVQPGLLGEALAKRQPPIPPERIPPASRPDERYYPETGHTVVYGFLAEFDRHGGLDTFGYPISEILLGSHGSLLQWFQRVQLQWWPDESGGEMRLAPLGERLYQERYAAPARPSQP
jgi:hypothetical protein